MSKVDVLKGWKLEDFKAYNEAYDKDKYKLSEAMKYDLDAIEKWISIRDTLTYTEEFVGNWKYLKIFSGYGTKYGTKWIFIDEEQKLWRIRETGNEFYNGPQCEQLTI